MAHRLQKVLPTNGLSHGGRCDGLRAVKYTPMQNHMRKIRKVLPRKIKRDEVVDIVTALVGTAAVFLHGAGVPDDRALIGICETARRIYGASNEGGSLMRNLQQADTPVVDFSKAAEDEELPVLPVPCVQQEEAKSA
jgi:hypothetical protein